MQQIVTFTSKGAIGAQAADGKFLWRYDQMSNVTANCSSPVYSNGKILYSSDYSAGCALLELKPDGSGLRCVACRRLYPVRDDIPVMLIDEATIED